MDLITFLFKIKYETYPGEEIYIFGDSPDFGNWKYPKFKLRWSEGHIWQANYQISKSSNNIKFKFVCHSNNYDKWEEGENRLLSTQHLNGLERTKEGKYILDCVWNHFKINFNIHYVPPNPDAYMQVVGDPMALSNWQKNNEKPVKMELKDDKEITAKDGNKIKGFWTVTTLMRNSDKSNFDFEYRYSLYDPKSGTAIWEREPNRHLHFFLNEEEIETFNNPKVSPDSCYLLTNSYLEILDVNFVANLVFNRMGDKKIYIGPYPQSLNDFKLISEAGINSILNVQSDKDLIFRQINHKLQLKQAKDLGIKINRYPIEDFNQEDLAEKLKGAGDLLNKLLKEGNTVYVHCTAGMSRAAATVIIYLVLYEDFTVEDAANFCKKHRPVICPNYGVINRIASIYKPGSEMKDGNIVNFIPSSFHSKISQEIEKERKKELERERERRRLREERRKERMEKEKREKERKEKEKEKLEGKKIVRKKIIKKKIIKKKKEDQKDDNNNVNNTNEENKKIKIKKIIKKKKKNEDKNIKNNDENKINDKDKNKKNDN
jgi:protein-tyrosine phosphatase